MSKIFMKNTVTRQLRLYQKIKATWVMPTQNSGITAMTEYCEIHRTTDMIEMEATSEKIRILMSTRSWSIKTPSQTRDLVQVLRQNSLTALTFTGKSSN